MGQITATRNLVATKVVRHAGQWTFYLRSITVVANAFPKLGLSHMQIRKYVTLYDNMYYCGHHHDSDFVMSAMASQITSLTIVYSTVYSGANQRKHQSSASLAFVWGIHRWPVNSPRKGPVTRKMFPFDDVIMDYGSSVGKQIAASVTDDELS